jgi:hypothetical protein
VERHVEGGGWAEANPEANKVPEFEGSWLNLMSAVGDGREEDVVWAERNKNLDFKGLLLVLMGDNEGGGDTIAAVWLEGKQDPDFDGSLRLLVAPFNSSAECLSLFNF